MNKVILSIVLALCLLGTCLAAPLIGREEVLQEKKKDLIIVENAMSMDQVLSDAASNFPDTTILYPDYIKMKGKQLADYKEIKELLEFEIRVMSSQSL